MACQFSVHSSGGLFATKLSKSSQHVFISPVLLLLEPVVPVDHATLGPVGVAILLNAPGMEHGDWHPVPRRRERRGASRHTAPEHQ